MAQKPSCYPRAVIMPSSHASAPRSGAARRLVTSTQEDRACVLLGPVFGAAVILTPQNLVSVGVLLFWPQGLVGLWCSARNAAAGRWPGALER